MAIESVPTEVSIQLRRGCGQGWAASRPYAIAAFDLICGQAPLTDEAVAIEIDTEWNARLVGLSHPEFAATLRAPGSLGVFAKTTDTIVLSSQMARIEARLPEAHRATQGAAAVAKEEATREAWSQASRRDDAKEVVVKKKGRSRLVKIATVGSPDLQLVADFLLTLLKKEACGSVRMQEQGQKTDDASRRAAIRRRNQRTTL